MPTPSSRKPVLLVEDDPFWYGIVRDALAPEHISFDWAKTSSECMTYLSTTTYSVIIMDLNLSGTEDDTQGIDLTTHLTGDWFVDYHRHTAIVVLTDNQDPDIRLSALFSGSINFQQKPRTHDDHHRFNKEFPVLISSIIYMIDPPDEPDTSSDTLIERGNIILTPRDRDTPPVISINDIVLDLRPKERLVLSSLMRSQTSIPDHMLQEHADIKSVNSLRETCRTINRELVRCSATLAIVRDFRGNFLDEV